VYTDIFTEFRYFFRILTPTFKDWQCCHRLNNSSPYFLTVSEWVEFNAPSQHSFEQAILQFHILLLKLDNNRHAVWQEKVRLYLNINNSYRVKTCQRDYLDFFCEIKVTKEHYNIINSIRYSMRGLICEVDSWDQRICDHKVYSVSELPSGISLP